jgi:hypothetical protein
LTCAGYSRQRWIAILNPIRATFDEVVKPLIAEAHERLAKQRHASRRSKTHGL